MVVAGCCGTALPRRSLLSPCGARLVGRLALRLALRMRHHVARDLVEVLLALHTRGWEERWEKRGTR